MFPLNVAAAAAGAGGIAWRIRSALTLTSSGFSGPSPAGWSWTNTGAGRYTFVHNANPTRSGIFFTDYSLNSSASLAQVIRTTTQSWSIYMTRISDSGLQNAQCWVHMIEPLDDSNTVQVAQITGTTGAFVGARPDGWTLTRTGTGVYSLVIAGWVAADYQAQGGGNALFVTGVGGQALAFGSYVFASGASYRISTVRNSDNGPVDRNFYLCLLRGKPETIGGVFVNSTGVISGANPRGMSVTKGATNSGIYTVTPQNTEPMDPRTGKQLCYTYNTSATSPGGQTSQSIPGASVQQLNTHRMSDSGPWDVPFMFQLIDNPNNT
jgi:hypothetical protein